MSCRCRGSPSQDMDWIPRENMSQKKYNRYFCITGTQARHITYEECCDEEDYCNKRLSVTLAPPKPTQQGV